MKNARAKEQSTKVSIKQIIADEVSIVLHMILRGDRPFQFTDEAKKAHRCPWCGNAFHKKVWFQLYDSPSCGNARRGKIARRWYRKHPKKFRKVGR